MVNVPAGAPAGLDQPFAPGLNSPRKRAFSSCGSQDGQPAMSVATCYTVLMEPVITASSPNEYIGLPFVQFVVVTTG